MRIVVFGPDKRIGALQGNRIVDLNHGMTEYLRQRGESSPEQKAAERVPARPHASMTPGTLSGGVAITARSTCCGMSAMLG